MNRKSLYFSALTGALLLAAGAAHAAQPELRLPQHKPPPRAVQVKPGAIHPVNPCPQGWKLASRGSHGAFMCEPQPVREFDCPHDTHFVRRGCAVGCEQTIY
ncbi:MAG: hypothetical protein L0H19_00835 [Salinisphaera sp.]|nr:hypothetical protein [Salinisphaera sp.]